MKKRLLFVLIACLAVPQFAFAGFLQDITTVRSDIENVRNLIRVENLKLERAIDRLSHSSDEVISQIETQKTDILEQISIEHDITMYEYDIEELKQEMEYDKLLREREYIVDYAQEGDKDAKQDIKDEYNADIDKLEDDYNGEKEDIELSIRDLKARLDSIDIVSLDKYLKDEETRHTDKLISITSIDRTEEEALGLLESDLSAVKSELSDYKSHRADFDAYDVDNWLDDSEKIKDSILDEINGLGDGKSDVKSDLLGYYEDQVHVLEDLINDRNNELEDVTEEIFDLSPTSDSRKVAEEQRDLLQDQINELRDLDGAADDWHQGWIDDVEVLFDEMIDNLSGELGGQDIVLQDKTADFNDQVFDLQYEVDQLLDNAPNSSVFSDVPVGHDFYEAVQYLYNEGITTGRTATLFMPDEKVLREEFVTFLMRAQYTDAEITALAAGSELGATDVPASSTLYKYIDAAYAAGITSGRTETTFGFGETIRRDEAIVMIVRAYNLTGDLTGISNPFSDLAGLPDEFKSSIIMAYKHGIIRESSTFRPQDPISRGESAKILWKVNI